MTLATYSSLKQGRDGGGKIEGSAAIEARLSLVGRSMLILVWGLARRRPWTPRSISMLMDLEVHAPTHDAYRQTVKRQRRLSVCLSVTRVDQAKTVQARIIKSSHFIRMLSWSILNGFGAIHSRRNSLLKCVLQPKITKNSLKPPILGLKVIQGHRCWYYWKSRQQCLL